MGLYLRGPKGPILKVTSPAQVVVPSPHHPPATAPDPPPPGPTTMRPSLRTVVCVSAFSLEGAGGGVGLEMGEETHLIIQTLIR